MILRASSNYMYNLCFVLNKPVSRSWNDDCSYAGFTIFSEHHRGEICSGWCWSYNE